MIRERQERHKKPIAPDKVEQWTLEAAVRRLQSLDELNAEVQYQEMLKSKSQVQRAWYEIKDLIEQDCIAALAGCGACKTAGSMGHKKKCAITAKTLSSLDPAYQADMNTIDKLLKTSRGLMPWSAELWKTMATMEDVLLERSSG